MCLWRFSLFNISTEPLDFYEVQWLSKREGGGRGRRNSYWKTTTKKLKEKDHLWKKIDRRKSLMSITTAKWVISPCIQNNVKICHLGYFSFRLFFICKTSWLCCISRLVSVVFCFSLSPSHIIVNSHYCALSSIQWYERVPPINKTSMWQVRVVRACVCMCVCV